MAINQLLAQKLDAEGYYELREIQGRGICGLMNFIFTVGLVWGIDDIGYVGRWCFPNSLEAKLALNEWTGIGDPSGEWIKYKAIGEERPRIPDPFDDNPFERSI